MLHSVFIGAVLAWTSAVLWLELRVSCTEQHILIDTGIAAQHEA